MVNVFSNTKKEPACQIRKLKFSSDNDVDNIQFQTSGWLLTQRECDMVFPLPRILKHTILSGHDIFSIMYHPRNFDADRKYPVVLNVYGGPEVQLVTNSFKVSFVYFTKHRLSIQMTMNVVPKGRSHSSHYPAYFVYYKSNYLDLVYYC